MYLAIDPGEHPGYAILSESMRLEWCGIDEPRLPRHIFKHVLCERPTIYPHSKVNPADIITLALTAGGQTKVFEEHGARVHWVEPRTWKGQVPKYIHHARIFSKLTPGEQDVVAKCLTGVSAKKREDAMDAVGLAMWAKAHRVFL